MIVAQVFAVIVLFGMFRAGFTYGWLARDFGPEGIHHAYLVVLLLIPAWHWSVYFLWAFGLFCYGEDVYKHHRRTKSGQENYQTPLHQWAWNTFLARVYMWFGWD